MAKRYFPNDSYLADLELDGGYVKIRDWSETVTSMAPVRQSLTVQCLGTTCPLVRPKDLACQKVVTLFVPSARYYIRKLLGKTGHVVPLPPACLAIANDLSLYTAPAAKVCTVSLRRSASSGIYAAPL
jgi:hypothetical protein